MKDFVTNWTEVKRVIEELECDVHKQRPKAVITNDNIALSECCCEDFKAECIEAAKMEMGHQATNYFREGINKTLKGQ